MVDLLVCGAPATVTSALTTFDFCVRMSNLGKYDSISLFNQAIAIHIDFQLYVT